MACRIVMLLVVAPMIISHAGAFQKGYSLTVSRHGRDFNTRVVVDVKRNSETFHVQEAASGKDAGDIVYDFQKNLTMIRVPGRKFCVLRDSIGNALSPSDLFQLLKLLSGSAAVKLTPQSEVRLKVGGKLNDRSGLSNEMADLCVNLPIYRVAEDVSQSDAVGAIKDTVEDIASVQGPAGRPARRFLCRLACKASCLGICGVNLCYLICYEACKRLC